MIINKIVSNLRNPKVKYWIKIIIVILLLIVSLVNGGDVNSIISILLGSL